ncbi:MAG: metallophosphoesterase [Sphingobacteriaceae bacterium]|jgi:UDP-2,3-diacylglucosamine pyrophosphatase LpxH|nr:metallophosphoesterase [Sphingobacteriaceae bacterium]
MRISRKKFLNYLGVMTAASATPKIAFPQGSIKTDNRDQPLFKSSVYMQSPSASSITLRWITSAPAYSWVEYGTDPGNLTQKAHQVTDGLVNAYENVCGIKITGLKSGATYYFKPVSKPILEFQPYKISYGEPVSGPVQSFTTFTPGTDQTSIIMLNDIHDRPESFATLLNLHDKKTDFIFLNGDMFNFQSGEQQLIDHLINPLTAASGSKLPFILSRGNHETRGLFARNIHPYFNEPGEKFYYAFTHGTSRIIVLDSGEDKKDDVEVYGGIVAFDQYREEQHRWLEKEVRSPEYKKAKYHIVFSHIPPYYSGEGYGTVHCRTLWGPIFNKAKVDVVLSGHTHKFGIHPAVTGQHNYPIVIGGGPGNGNRTITSIKTDSKHIYIKVLGDNGEERGTLTI